MKKFHELSQEELARLRKEKPYLLVDGCVASGDSDKAVNILKEDIRRKKMRLAEMTLHKADTTEIVDYIKRAEEFLHLFLEASVKFRSLDRMIELSKAWEETKGLDQPKENR